MASENKLSERELLDRIRQLEEQNSALQDKLDMIYAILAPDFEKADEEEPEGHDFVQIETLGAPKKQIKRSDFFALAAIQRAQWLLLHRSRPALPD
jgi:hypothetical protein